VLQGFINQFGIANAKGVYAISSLHTSLLSSLAFIGKFAGCVLAGPLIERWGHRAVFLILAAVSYVGIVSTYNTISAGMDGRLRRVAVELVGCRSRCR
jgi:SP family sugar:H+ symporter-like MFS transporter